MIDPACGSGHFLLGAFERLLKHWRKKEPGAAGGDRELVNRALASVHGVDLNPYAVAIARFRLLIAAMRECQITRLADAPAFTFNLVCGDSLLHGPRGGAADKGASGRQVEFDFGQMAHHYAVEDTENLDRILTPGQYHAVVANPPYITVKDKALNQAYRELYPEVCYKQYSLSVPFLQRLFMLAADGGFTGQITANSFMKREFGKKLIESYLPKIDLAHVVDTSGAYIPGHGTPTVILFGRNRPPVLPTIRAVLGIKGEPHTPTDPSQGLVWTAILKQIDQVGSESDFVSVNDTSREQFGKHPWSIGGGGASELKEQIDHQFSNTLGDIATSIGFCQDTHADDAFVQPLRFFSRQSICNGFKPQIRGDNVRDWGAECLEGIVFPYNDQLKQWRTIPKLPCWAWLHALRTELWGRSTFGGGTYRDAGRPWFDFHQFPKTRLKTALSLIFPAVGTHNHFMLDRGGRVFNRSAPVIKLTHHDDEDIYLDVLGLLNSSSACFWMKQVFHNKGSTVDQHGARQRTMPFEDFYDIDGAKLKRFSLQIPQPINLAQQLDTLAQTLSALTAAALVRDAVPTAESLAVNQQRFALTRARMIALQEELDWQCYGLYDLITEEDVAQVRCDNPPPLELGQRAFEIVLARRMAAGEEETTWFTRHGSMPITQIPKAWPKDYQQVVQHRIDLIQNSKNIGLIERPEYKRRWNTEPWDKQQEQALKNWLLDRLESYFDLDGRMNDQQTITAHALLVEPKLTSVARVADMARADQDFMQVAEIYQGRMDFDVANLVGELIEAESVPALPVLRYKPKAMDKRQAWERTWELQRQEDAIDAMFEVDKLKDRTEQTPVTWPAQWSISEVKMAVLKKELTLAVQYVTEAMAKGLNLESDEILKPIHDAAKRANQKVVGDIPVPPKYTSADFLDKNHWRLRGKLDVPKERWVCFPHCEGEDGTLVIAWAGYDHLQLTRAIAERYELARENQGLKLVPLLTAIGQLIPWLKQWHNDPDMAFNGLRMGDFFEEQLAEDAKALDMSVQQVMDWQPPAKKKKTRKKKTAGRKKKKVTE